jgi:hypothetical protein
MPPPLTNPSSGYIIVGSPQLGLANQSNNLRRCSIAMFKIRLLVGLSALVTTLVVLAAPAMAEFESKNGQTRGPIKTFPAETIFKGATGGPSITCKNASGEPKGEWWIQVKAFKQQGKYFFQELATKGPHEQLKIEKWGHCVGPALLEVKVKCNLQVESNGTNSVGTGSVYPVIGQTEVTGCVAFVGTEGSHCIVNVSQDGNKELQKVGLVNIGTEEVGIKGEVTGIRSTLQETTTEIVKEGIKEKVGKCKELAISSTPQGTGTFTTSENLVTLGQKLV